MNKARLHSFIEKYHLGKLVESVKWSFVDGRLSTTFGTPDKALLGMVHFKEIEMPDIELGIYTTSQLESMLKVLGDDVTIAVVTRAGKNISLRVADPYNHINFMLADMNVIPTPPSLQGIPPWDITLDLPDGFSSTFVKSLSALPNDTFTIINDNGQLTIVLGYSQVNSSRITINVEGNATTTFSPMSFKASYVASVLRANSEIPVKRFNINSQGLLNISFADEDFAAEYYIVKSDTP